MKRNTKAKKNCEAIEITHNTRFYLLKSQIAQFEGNDAAALEDRNAYFLCLKRIIMERCIINITL
jgi:hypothetical protein